MLSLSRSGSELKVNTIEATLEKTGSENIGDNQDPVRKAALEIIKVLKPKVMGKKEEPNYCIDRRREYYISNNSMQPIIKSTEYKNAQEAKVAIIKYIALDPTLEVENDE